MPRSRQWIFKWAIVLTEIKPRKTMKSALSALNLTCTFSVVPLSDCGRFEREGLIFTL